MGVFYYSIGGGSAPYSEAYATYDETGTLVQDDKNPRSRKALADTEYDRMKKVRSIMPD